MTTQIKYFNLANSYFEALMEPWKFDIRVSRGPSLGIQSLTVQAQRTSVSPGSNPLSVRISAAERLEVNLTSAFVELAITSMTVWSKHSEKASDERGDAAPFRIVNRTGLTMLIWPESRDQTKQVTGVKEINDGESQPWRFENAHRAREVRPMAGQVARRWSALC